MNLDKHQDTMDKIKLWWPSLGAALVFGINMLINIPNLPMALGYPLDIWLIFILLLAEIFILNHEITSLKNARPNVVPEGTGFDKLESLFPLWSGNTHSDYKVQRYFLPLRQKRTGNIRLVDTQPINTKICFYDIDGKELENLSHEKAFWFNAKPRVQRRNPEDHEFVIPASGKATGICLVIRKEGEQDLYVFNDDSYYPGTGSIVFNKSMIIPQKSVYIFVELSSANLVINPIWMKLTNLGKDKQPIFELIDNPFKKNIEKKLIFNKG